VADIRRIMAEYRDGERIEANAVKSSAAMVDANLTNDSLLVTQSSCAEFVQYFAETNPALIFYIGWLWLGVLFTRV
jgi:hypothetical protein